MKRRRRSGNKTIKVGRCAVKIRRKVETNEYVVQTVIGGRVVGGKDGGYFTESPSDARGTAAAVIRQLRKDKACR